MSIIIILFILALAFGVDPEMLMDEEIIGGSIYIDASTDIDITEETIIQEGSEYSLIDELLESQDEVIILSGVISTWN